jgi:hypothetical protein
VESVDLEWAVQVKVEKVTRVVAVMAVQEWTARLKLQRFLQQRDHQHKY